MNDSLFYSTQDLHELIGVTRKTVQNWAAKQLIPGQIRVGHSWKFKKEIVNKALENENFLSEPLN